MPEDDLVTEQFEASRPRLGRLRTGCSAPTPRRRMPSRRPGCASTGPTGRRREPRRLAHHRDRPRVPGPAARHAAPRREAPSGRPAAEPTGGGRRRRPGAPSAHGRSVGAALLVVLDLLAPAERVAFVLHDVFAVPFDEIADDRRTLTEAARQLASRARRRVRGTAPRPTLDLVRQRQVVDAFLRRGTRRRVRGLVGLLDPDVVLRPMRPPSDGGRCGRRGRGRGGDRVVGWARGRAVAIVDGLAGFVWAPGGRTAAWSQFTIARREDRRDRRHRRSGAAAATRHRARLRRRVSSPNDGSLRRSCRHISSSGSVIAVTVQDRGGIPMQFVLLIYQGTTPLPGHRRMVGALRRRAEADLRRLRRAQQDARPHPRPPARAAPGCEDRARRERHETSSAMARTSTPRAQSAATSSSRRTTSTPRSRWRHASPPHATAARSRSGRSPPTGSCAIHGTFGTRWSSPPGCPQHLTSPISACSPKISATRGCGSSIPRRCGRTRLPTSHSPPPERNGSHWPPRS